MAQLKALVFAGGGGGGQGAGSGGGGGGYLYEAAHTISAGSYSITVGLGGLFAPAVQGSKPGSNSIFDNMTAYGGGAGKNSSGGYSPNGGCGAGGYYASTAAGTGSQGYGGGTAIGVVTPYVAGGGGGAGEAGQNASGSNSGRGGDGVQNPIAGSTLGQNITGVYWICGGGGCSATLQGGAKSIGGKGGGVDGPNYFTVPPNAADNTGGGGASSHDVNAANGGSGGVVLAYKTDGSDGISTASTGGTITTSGEYTLHTFTSNGTFTPDYIERIGPFPTINLAI